MPGTIAPEIGRRPLQGVAQILRYNWPYYAVSVAGIAAGIALASLELPVLIKMMVVTALSLTAFWLASSIVVSFYVYDLSPLYRWEWLRAVLPGAPQTWVSFNAGLDETSAAIGRLFPFSEGSSLDFYDPARMKEHSIERARRSRPAGSSEGLVDFASLPLLDCSCDATFLILAAHEIRDPQDRVRFLKEVRRILKPGGRVILVEHLRDAWNLAAYGPGVRHFFPRSEWLRNAKAAGLAKHSEQSLTPFVRCFVLEREYNV